MTSDPKPAASPVDVAVIGGGPAGMQSALVLARAGKRVVVFDDPRPPRNAASHGMHNVFGMDGLLPTEIRDIAWRQIEVYGGVEQRRAEVMRVRIDDHGLFELETPDGAAITARKVIAAFGYRDVLPDIPGFSACWAGTIIPCPFCDGHENRGGRWGVVCTKPGHVDVFPALARNWADELVIILPPSLARRQEHAAALEQAGYEVLQGVIEHVHHDAGVLRAISLDSGDRVELGTLLWEPPSQRVPLLERMIDELGVEVADDGSVVTDANCETGVPGLFAVGDLEGWVGALGAAYQGNVAASHIVRSWHR